MVVLTIGHQDRCILWVQGATLNKGIGFLCGLKLFALDIYFVKNTYNKDYVWCCNYAKKNNKDVPMNEYKLWNTKARSFNVFWNTANTQSPEVNCKY